MINICSGCGRTIQRNFVYCPWCGNQTARSGSNRSIENSYEVIQDLRYNEQEKKIESVGRQIEELEKELNILVLSTQLAR